MHDTVGDLGICLDIDVLRNLVDDQEVAAYMPECYTLAFDVVGIQSWAVKKAEEGIP